MDRKKTFLDELSADKPESFKEEVFEPAGKSWGRMAGLIAVVVLAAAAFFIIPHVGDITVPDMSDWQYEDIEAWAAKHHDNTILNGAYSIETANNNVISQDISPGQKIGKNRALTVKYSLGADPEETIKIPDIMNMGIADIKKWISDNQLSGISIKQEESEIIPKDKVINYELVDGTAEEYKRKNRMIIYVSNGAVNLDETFLMPDLYGKTRTEIMQWSKEQQISVKINEVFNQDVEYGKVCNQSMKKDMKITRKDSIEVSISRGKALLVPDFTGMTRSEAQELAKLLGMNAFFKLVVNREKEDTVISQDVAARSKIDQKQVVTIEVSKKEGKVVMPDFRGLSSAEANSLAALYGIKVFIRSEAKTGENGTVISQSVKPGVNTDEDQVVTLVLKESSEKITVPDFTGLSKNKAAELAKNSGIELLFNEEETMMVKNQTVISQDAGAKKFIRQGEAVLLTVAVNSGIEAVNLWDMELREAKAWALQKGVTLNVVESYSDTYPSGTIFYQDCDEGRWIPVSKTVTVYYSLGKVFVPDFTGKSKPDIIKWRDEVNAEGAEIALSFREDYNTSKGKGIITKQSIFNKDSALDTAIEVWVSASDDGVLIPDFEGTAYDDFKLWCDANSIPCIVKDCYSGEYPAGTLYGQNYKDTYLPGNTYLRINKSLGRVYIEDFTDRNKQELVKWQKEVNEAMAGIQIEYIYMYSMNTQKGCIISQSVKDAELETGSKITVTVSSGLVN